MIVFFIVPFSFCFHVFSLYMCVYVWICVYTFLCVLAGLELFGEEYCVVVPCLIIHLYWFVIVFLLTWHFNMCLWPFINVFDGALVILPVEIHSPGEIGRSLSRLPFMSLGPAQKTSDTVAFVFFSQVISHLFSQLHWKELPRRSLTHDREGIDNV